jgi:hypothetical protein
MRNVSRRKPMNRRTDEPMSEAGRIVLVLVVVLDFRLACAGGDSGRRMGDA